MRILITVVALFCLVAVISAKKQHSENSENVDALETEGKVHSMKKYSKEHQKSHHHNHKHKKHAVEEELISESEPKAKKGPVEVPEPEIELQENIETSKKAVEDSKHREQLQDIHLQDLTYEENLKKEKKKKGHHGAHRAEILEKNDEKAEKKLFAEHESKHAVDEKVIEDSFEPLQEHAAENGKNKKSKDKKNKEKSKDKSKNKKKAYEKGGKDKHNKKSKDGKKNKDKKNKNKDKKY